MSRRILAVGALFCAVAACAFGQTTLTLDQCRDLARTNNVAYRNSLLERDAARQTRKAMLTKYFPSVSAGGAIFRSQDELIEKTIQGGNLPVYDGNPAHLRSATQYAYFPDMSISMMHNGTVGMVTAVQPVFAGGRIVNANRLAALGADAAEDQVRLASNEVDLTTEQKFRQIAARDGKLETLRSYRVFLDTLSRQVDDAFRSGVILKNDLLKVRTKRSEVAVQLSKAENGRVLALMSFCQFMGIPYDSTLTLAADSTTPQSPWALYVDHKDALYDRPEFSLLEKSVKAEKMQTALKIGEYLPQAGVGVGGFYTQFDKEDGETNGLIFGTVSVPISGWWEAAHSVKERKLKEKIASNAAQDHREQLLLQMDKAWRDLTDAEKEVLLSQETERQADENRKVALDSYHAGIVTLTDLLDAEATLQQARDQVIESKANYHIKQSTYLKVTGR